MSEILIDHLTEMPSFTIKGNLVAMNRRWHEASKFGKKYGLHGAPIIHGDDGILFQATMTEEEVLEAEAK